MKLDPLLLERVRQCQICKDVLPNPPRPLLQFHPDAKVLITGQAPGKKAHETSTLFNDPSGDRLRKWMGVSQAVFYDPKSIAILPMGFCYPGKGKSGDLPPRPECAPAWRELLLEQMTNLELIIVIGRYAQDYYFGKDGLSVTERVKNWQACWPDKVSLPHPSPRNNPWLKKNPWFEQALIPVLQKRIAEVLL